MNALSFASAYKQLRPAQKAYVDAYVAETEREAVRRNERISLALFRAIPADVVEASRGLLDMPLVRAAIVERINELAIASELTVQRVIKEIANMAFSTVESFMTVGEDGQAYIDLNRATPEAMSAVKSIEVEETGSLLERSHKRKTKVVLHDKIAAIKMLVDYMGINQPDNPFWRADQARPAHDRAALPDGTTADSAADIYGQLING